jgi:hypothetical protein
VKTTHQLLRLLAAATALSLASVHVAILNQHLEEKPYVGGLFLAAILALQVALELAQERRDRVLDAALEGLFGALAVANAALVGIAGSRAHIKPGMKLDVGETAEAM